MAELAGLSQPRTQTQTALQQQIQHNRSAMTLQFQDVLAGEGVGRGEKQSNALIERLTRIVQKGAKARRAGGGQQTDHRFGDGTASGAADTNYAYPPTARGSGDGGDGVR